MERLKTRGQQVDQIDIKQPQVSGFDISSFCKGTCQIGKVVPTRMKPLLAGDRIKGSSQINLNFEPLAVPIMSNMQVKQETFVVPYRLLWSNFKRFVGRKKDFNTPIPSTSLWDIHTAFGVFTGIHVSADSGSYLSVVPDGPAKYLFFPIMRGSDYISTLTGNIDKYQVRDIIADGFISFYDSFCDEWLHALYDFCSYVGSVTSWDFHFESFEDFESRYWSSVSEGECPYLSLSVSAFAQYVLGLSSSEVDKLHVGLKYFVPLVSYIVTYTLRYFGWFFGSGSLFDYLRAPKFDSFRAIEEFNSYIDSCIMDIDFNTFQLILNELDSRDYSSLVRVLFQGVSNRSWTGIFAYYNDPLVFLKRPSVSFPSTVESAFEVRYLSNVKFNWLPFRANYWIWYYNYRDRLLEYGAIDPEDYVGDVPATEELVLMSLIRYRAWSKDMFTTALADTGSGNVYVPTTASTLSAEIERKVGADYNNVGDNEISETFALNGTVYRLPSKYLSTIGSSESSESSPLISVDSIHRARRLARWLQKNLIVGVEYDDILFSHWAVHLSDKTLQQPEYIDGSTRIVNIDTVVNNTSTVEQIAGDKTGLAYGNDQTGGFNYFCEEWSYLLSYMSVLPLQSYPYGVDREYFRRECFDLPWVEFADLGMDAVYNAEIQTPNGRHPLSADSSVLASVGDESSQAVFGYQGRYYDFKSSTDEEHGRLLDELSYYTFGRRFDYTENGMPKLNYEFIHCRPNLDMFVVADNNTHLVRYDIKHSLAAQRRLPVSSTENY